MERFSSLKLTRSRIVPQAVRRSHAIEYQHCGKCTCVRLPRGRINNRSMLSVKVQFWM